MKNLSSKLMRLIKKPMRMTRAADSIHPAPPPPVDWVVAADRLRDAGNTAEAAAAYARILEQKPYLTGIRVQYANMLKDSGDLLDAEAAYRQAIMESPDDADIHLQLGHVLKLLGRRPAALAAYERAAELDPLSHAALQELSEAGRPDALLRRFNAQLRHGGVDVLLALADGVASVRARLDEFARALPDARAAVAFPISGWGQFRRIFDVPAPPASTSGVAVLLWSDPKQSGRLYEQLTAIRAQSHPNWRAVVLGSDAPLRELVERAAAADPRIAWHEVDPTESPGCAEIRAGDLPVDWLILAAPGAILHPHAFGWVLEACALGGARAFIFDEECGSVEDGQTIRSSPTLRQVVDHDTLLEANVFGQNIAIRKDAFLAMADRLCATSVAALRSSVLLESGRIGHIPLPLIRTSVPGPAADRDAHLQALAHYRPANGARPSPAPTADIAVVIPTHDNVSDVREFVASLRDTAARPDNLDILIVDNRGSSATAQALEGLKPSNVRVMRIDEPFNWSRLNNLAASETIAPTIVFANDDMRMLTRAWDDVLLRLLWREGVGAVGARLLYPDDTLQHGGVLMGWRGSVIHDGLHRPADDPGPLDRWRVTRAVGAVTGAFLATRRDIFRDVKGFDEAELPVAYSDVDYALKVREAGLRVLWTPHLTLRHYESKTRGLDHEDEHKAIRNEAERLVLTRRWGQALNVDPGVHPLWSDATLPFSLISPMSEAGMRSHLRCCAAAKPWQVGRRLLS